MNCLNDLDLLHFKYMVIGTGVLNKDAVKTIKYYLVFIFSTFYNISDYQEIINLMSGVCGKDISEELVYEMFYHLKCYNIIHRNQICPKKYEKDDFRTSLNDETYEFKLH